MKQSLSVKESPQVAAAYAARSVQIDQYKGQLMATQARVPFLPWVVASHSAVIFCVTSGHQAHPVQAVVVHQGSPVQQLDAGLVAEHGLLPQPAQVHVGAAISSVAPVQVLGFRAFSPAPFLQPYLHRASMCLRCYNQAWLAHVSPE